MAVFSAVDFDHHENVVFCHDKDTGLKAIIAIHNTALGPALGGCRMWAYENDSEALTDVLRLSRGMTYKSALAGLPLGGGKAVIIGDAKTDKSPELFHAFGRFIERLCGAYITAEDVGTTVEDMVQIRTTTSHVAGLPGGAGDPSPMTALGVFQSIKASVAYALEKDSLSGVKVAVKGLGNVGSYLCQYLAEDGAQLVVTDIDQQKVKKVCSEYNAQEASIDDIHAANVDVFAPCALGGGINPNTLPEFNCRIIAGGANNQLSTPDMADRLRERGILYAPDYIVNAGGIISVAYEKNYNRDKVIRHIEGIRDTLLSVFRLSDEHKTSTESAAFKLAKDRLEQAANSKKTAFYL